MWQIKTTPTKDLPQRSRVNSESDDDTAHNRSCSSVRTKMIEDATQASRAKRSRKSNGSVVQTVLGAMKFGRKRVANASGTSLRDSEDSPSSSGQNSKSPKMKRNLWGKARSEAVDTPSRSTPKLARAEEVTMCSVSDSPTYLFKDFGNSCEFFDLKKMMFRNCVPDRYLRDDMGLTEMAAKGKVAQISAICNAQPERMLSRDEKQASMLHHAAAEGRTRVMDYILSDPKGQTLLEERDEFYATPIFWAVENDNAESVEYLISNGADPTAFNSRGEAPIHVSIRTHNMKVLRTLIKYKGMVDMNQPQKITCVTPMHVAAEHDNVDAAIELLGSGAKLCLPCQQGYRPLHVAALNGSKRVLKLLVEKCAEAGYTSEQILSFNDKELCSPLHCAVLGGNAEVIEMCLSYGARLDTRQADNTTPMHMVCAQGAYNVVESMFNLASEQAQRTLSMQDKQKHTPLHKAAMYGHATIVKYLADRGADLDIPDAEQNTPLLLAASRGNWISVQDLIELGADFMIKNKDERNFLHMVVLNGGDIKELEIRSEDGKSFRETCRGIFCKPDVQELLNQADLDGCTPLHYACQEGNLASLETLMTLGVSAKLKSAGNQSPLHFAARYGRYNACKKLLSCPQGPNIINEKDHEGMTPLHYASQNGHVKIVQLLLNKGAVCHRNIRGESVLHVTAISGYTKTMKILITMNKTLLDAADDFGNTPLHHAGMETQVNVVKLLLDLGARISRNDDGHTFFTQAIVNQNRDVALAVIMHERWNQAMQEFYFTESSIGVASLLMIQYLPDIWVMAMNRCIDTADCSPKDKDYWIKYEFKYLQPNVKKRMELESKLKEVFAETGNSAKMVNGQEAKGSNAGSVFTLPALNTMVQYNRVECLRHPVSTAYLQMKWNAYGRWVHGLNILIYLLGLIPLTYLICTMDTRPTAHNEVYGFPNETNRFTSRVVYPTFQFTVMILLTVLSFGQLIKELVQMYQQRSQYFLDVTNMVEWILYVSSLLYVMPFLIGYPIHWQFEFGAVAVLLAWFNLLLFFQRFDVTGIYVVMFLVILKTLCKVLALFSFLIVAFTMSFYALLHNEPADASFSTPPLSMLRVITMTLGEINYIDKFMAPLVDDNTNTLHYSTVTILLLLSFFVVMPILLMNLLIGLAVGDIAEVQSNAELQRLAMQVQLHTDIEAKLSSRILRVIDKDEWVIWPNKTCGPLQKMMALVTAKDEAVPHLTMDFVSFTDRNINHLHTEIQKQKDRIKDMQSTLSKQHDLLRLIVQKMEIRSEAENQDEGVSPDYQNPAIGGRGVSSGVKGKLVAASAFKSMLR